MKKLTAAVALLAALALTTATAEARSEPDPAEEVAELVDDLLPSATAETCQHPVIAQPFAFLGDTFDYVLAPDGSFEGTEGEGWLLDGGAAVIAGNDPFPLHPASPDEHVLSLPDDASAVSAPMCVDLDYPHARLVIRQQPTERDRFRGRLKVETLYPDAKRPRWSRVDVIRVEDGEWTVSDFIDLEPERGGDEPGGRQVSLRFIALGGGGAFEIDDLYVDPRFRH